MKGIGTDEAALIAILGNRNQAEIAAIKQAYLQKHGKDLLSAIKSETSGDFARAMTGLLKDPRQYDADALFEAMKGAGTDEFTLMLVLIGRNNEQKAAINTFYTRDHSKSVENAITSETSGDLKKLIVGLTGNRDPDHTPVNEDAARADAEKLYSAGEGKLGTDERSFIEVFTRKSWPHLKRVFAIYETIHKHHTMERAIEGEFSGFLKTGLLGVVIFARNPGEFYADAAHKSMKGVGTDEKMLTHVIVGNRDRLAEIKQAYSAKYGKTLWQAVNGETSGDFKKTLLALIGNN